MLTKNNILEFLKEYKKKHAQEYHLSRLGVFGSVARGDDTVDSDLDIVVELTRPNLFIQSQIREDLKDAFGREVDVVVLSKYINPKLLKRIERDALYA